MSLTKRKRCLQEIGRTYGSVLILAYVGRAKDGHALYKAVCKKCGHVYQKMTLSHIKRVDSCNHFVDNPRRISDSRINRIFRNMIRRCYDSSTKSYPFYGGRGISICEEWLNNPKEFERWSFEHGYCDDLSIDRKNPSLGYEPSNCRWIPLKDNLKWKSSTHSFEVDGIIDSGKGWATRLGVNVNIINRYFQCHSKEETENYIRYLMKNEFVTRKARQLTIDKETHTFPQWSRILGLSENYVDGYWRKYGEEKTIERISGLLTGKIKNTPKMFLIDVDGVVKNAKEWSIYLGKTPSYVSLYCSRHGYDKTVSRIKYLLNNPV